MTKPIKSKLGRGFAIVAGYLILLFGCAGLFMYCASDSHGEDFIFREDLLLPIQIDEALRRLGVDEDDEEIRHEAKDLLLYDKRVHRQIVYDRLDDLYEGYEPLGYVWADFYLAYCQSLGVTHCIIEYHDTPKFDPYPYHYKEVLISICTKFESGSLLDMAYDFPVVSLSHVAHALEVKTSFDLSVDWSLYSENKPEDEIDMLDSGDPYVVPINSYYFHDLVASTYWTPDGALNIFSEVYNSRDYSYPYWDFFYFSAVALTTLGYGDILPNSTRIRVLVAIEAILGIAALTALVGVILSPRHDHSKYKGS